MPKPPKLVKVDADNYTVGGVKIQHHGRGLWSVWDIHHGGTPYHVHGSLRLAVKHARARLSDRR